MFRNYKMYKTINIFIASHWQKKKPIWQENLKIIENRCKGTEIKYFNLGYEQRTLMSKLDDVKRDEDLVKIMQFVSRHEDQFTMRESPYGIITAKHGITDYYGYHAEKKGISIEKFDNMCKNYS